jgi:hypothetical protein
VRWLLACGLAACGGSSPASIDGAPGDGAADAPGPDAPAPQPITAPPETWTFVPIDGMQCADGSPTGVGVNLTSKSDDVMVFFEGGGACWDTRTCFEVGSAIHVTGGYGASDFATDEPVLAASWIFQRGDATNPFAKASWIFVPYCTGDLHIGAKATTIASPTGDKVVHFAGRVNADTLLRRASVTRPQAPRVWLVGASAGGYATAFDLDLALAVWPGAEVSALDDSGPLVAAGGTAWHDVVAAWGPLFPPTCTGCPTDLAAMADAVRLELAGGRYGLLQYTNDPTIATFLQLPPPTLASEVGAAAAAMTGAGDEAAFQIAGATHTLLATPNVATTSGVTVRQWVTQWATGDAAWANAGP